LLLRHGRNEKKKTEQKNKYPFYSRPTEKEKPRESLKEGPFAIGSTDERKNRIKKIGEKATASREFTDEGPEL